MSSSTIRKAQKLVNENAIAKIEEELYQVRSSSDPTKSYFVTLSSCDCEGFQNFYRFHHGKGIKANCSHLQAVKIYRKQIEGVQEKEDMGSFTSQKDKRKAGRTTPSSLKETQTSSKTATKKNYNKRGRKP